MQCNGVQTMLGICELFVISCNRTISKHSFPPPSTRVLPVNFKDRPPSQSSFRGQRSFIKISAIVSWKYDGVIESATFISLGITGKKKLCCSDNLNLKSERRGNIEQANSMCVFKWSRILRNTVVEMLIKC